MFFVTLGDNRNGSNKPRGHAERILPMGTSPERIPLTEGASLPLGTTRMARNESHEPRCPPREFLKYSPSNHRNAPNRHELNPETTGIDRKNDPNEPRGPHRDFTHGDHLNNKPRGPPRKFCYLFYPWGIIPQNLWSMGVIRVFRAHRRSGIVVGSAPVRLDYNTFTGNVALLHRARLQRAGNVALN